VLHSDPNSGFEKRVAKLRVSQDSIRTVAYGPLYDNTDSELLSTLKSQVHTKAKRSMVLSFMKR
jgi:hypothetical protein